MGRPPRAERRSPLLIWNPLFDSRRLALLRHCEIAGWEMLGGGVIVWGAVALCACLVRDGLVRRPRFIPAIAGRRGGARLPARGHYRQGFAAVAARPQFLRPDAGGAGAHCLLPGLLQCVDGAVASARISNTPRHSRSRSALTSSFRPGSMCWPSRAIPSGCSTACRLRSLRSCCARRCSGPRSGSVYALTVLAICAWHIRSFESADLSYTLVALAGVVIYSFIASGLGMLATDPLEVEVKRRIRPGMIYLYMILASLYGYALYSHSTWARLGQIVLSSLLAYALWQKVRDRAPFLLDAVSMPPPRVSLADGLMAALGFFVLQGVLTLFFGGIIRGPAGSSPSPYSSAGALVVAFTLLMFLRARVVGVLSAVGITGPRDGRRAARHRHRGRIGSGWRSLRARLPDRDPIYPKHRPLPRASGRTRFPGRPLDRAARRDRARRFSRSSSSAGWSFAGCAARSRSAGQWPAAPRYSPSVIHPYRCSRSSSWAC